MDMDDEIVAAMIESAARALCERAGHDPDKLEPGNLILHPLDDVRRGTDTSGRWIEGLVNDGTRPPDGETAKGTCHFMWRSYIEEAQVSVRAAIRVLRERLIDE